MAAILGKISAGLATKDYETSRLRKDGTTFPVSVTISPVRDSHGVVAGVSAIVRDLGDHRKAWGRRREDRASALVESIGEAITSSTPEGVITSWNPAAERLFGYTSEEMIGTSSSRLTSPDLAGEMGQILAQVTSSHSPRNVESMLVRRDGTTFPTSLTISPILDADGAVIGVCAIVRDLTGQRRDQREIAEWRHKAFTWMEDLEQSQRLSVMRDFERELNVIDLQQEVERLRRLATPDPSDLGDERQP